MKMTIKNRCFSKYKIMSITDNDGKLIVLNSVTATDLINLKEQIENYLSDIPSIERIKSMGSICRKNLTENEINKIINNYHDVVESNPNENRLMILEMMVNNIDKLL